MRPAALRTLLAALVVACASTALCADAPVLKEASLVTDVLPWGETVTALRLEYSDEIPAAELTALMPSQTSDSSLVKFHVFADRAITHVYVNNSGTKDDVAPFGKFVFINLGIQNMDPTTYRSHVTFNPATKTRPRLPGYTVSQTGPITTRSGAVIAPVVLASWDAGFVYALKGFIGAILGGLRSPAVAVLGGLGVGVAESLAAGYLSSGWKDAIDYGLLLAFLLIRGGVFLQGRASLMAGGGH